MICKTNFFYLYVFLHVKIVNNIFFKAKQVNYRHGTKIWESQRTTSVNIDWNIRNGVVKHCVSIKQATFLLLLENQHIRIKSLKTKVQKIRAKKTSWLLKHVCVDLISWNCFRQTAVMWERRRVSSRGGKRKRCIVVSALVVLMWWRWGVTMKSQIPSNSRRLHETFNSESLSLRQAKFG